MYIRIATITLFVFTAITLLFLESYASTMSGCKDIGLHYGSSSICFEKGAGKNNTQLAQPVVLSLFDMRNPHDEGFPIVFVGKLVTKSGQPVKDAVITIKHDGTCANKTIGSAKTDNTGKFYIFTIAKIWDKKDNMIKAHAEFTGKKGFLPATSESKIIVVYPLQNKGC
jgi:hypothetical protein